MHTLYTEFLNELDYWNQFVRTLGYMKAPAYSKTSLCQKAKRFQVYMVSLMMLNWQDRWFTQGKGRRKNSPLPWVLAPPPAPWLGTSLWLTHVGGQGFSLQVLCLSSGRGMALQYLSSTGVPLSSTHSTSARFVPNKQFQAQVVLSSFVEKEG